MLWSRYNHISYCANCDWHNHCVSLWLDTMTAAASVGCQYLTKTELGYIAGIIAAAGNGDEIGRTILEKIMSSGWEDENEAV